jgi:hypothetical protein
MTDLAHLPKSELDGLALEVREEIEVMQDVLRQGEFSAELRVVSLQTCELVRLEERGARHTREYRGGGND